MPPSRGPCHTRQLEAKEDAVGALVLCHTRELAYQICNEFERFSRYLPDYKTKARPIHRPFTNREEGLFT